MAGIDDVIAALMGGAQSGMDKATQLGAPLLRMFQSEGGFGGVVSSLQDSSIGQQVQSWVSNGPNLPVSPSQVADALGADRMKQLAEQSGLSVDDVASSLSQLLPSLIDKLTPTGQVPGADQLQSLLSKIPGADTVTGLVSSFIPGRK